MAAKKTVRKAKAKKTTPTQATTAVKKAMTKSVIMAEVAENTGLTKKQVSSVFDELTILIERHIKPRGPKQFILPGLLKIEVKRKPATKARKGINPFTGEEMMFKAKPARDIVKIRPLKKVKDMVG
jgi:nucleoid DNA-binding protein